MEHHYKLQKDYYHSGITKSYDFRINNLKRLKSIIQKYENHIIKALKSDLNKPKFEAYTAEILMIYSEIDYAIKNLASWMKPERVKTPLYLQPAQSYIYHHPKGLVLIISPWNYPFQLTMSPLVGAIAAGNCITIKPSSQSKNTSYIISKMIRESFDPEYIHLIEGPGSSLGPIIAKYRYDHIFFTGSQETAKQILGLTAHQLISTNLELGGKSPVIVCQDANLKVAAKRIAWAKFYNCGQTCVAPDYLLVDSRVKDELVDHIKYYILKFYGPEPSLSPDYGRIINDKAFQKLSSLLQGSEIIFGGQTNQNTRYIAPSLIDNVSLDSLLMKSEIFGPLLPILSFQELNQAMEVIDQNPDPLALYLFTKSKKIEKQILNHISFGGGCINHLISHVANPFLPFGGVGYSGMGNYHLKYSFDSFSNKKTILKASTKDTNLIYPPYSEKKITLSRKFF